jgi:multidrug efflux pump subunit AcrA (membrane-fusion protein)
MKFILNLFKRIYSLPKIYLVLILIVILVSGYFIYRKIHTKNVISYQTSIVQKGTLTSSVTGDGNIIADQSAKIDPSISG